MSTPTPPVSTPATASLNVVEEHLSIGRTVEETGAVRVRVAVGQHDETVALEQVAAQVLVERVAVNRIVEQRSEPWEDGDCTVVPVYAEVAVVERRLVLVEELRLRRQTVRSSHSETVPLRRERAVVERRQADGSWVEEPRPADDEAGPGHARR